MSRLVMHMQHRSAYVGPGLELIRVLVLLLLLLLPQVEQELQLWVAQEAGPGGCAAASGMARAAVGHAQQGQGGSRL